MLQPGTLTAAGDWVEAHSLARAIETEMIADALLALDEETPDATLQRRKTFVAMARGIITYFKTHMDITLAVGDLRATGEAGARLPAADKTYSVSAGQVTIGAGSLRAAGDAGVAVPLAAKTLSGKVS